VAAARPAAKSKPQGSKFPHYTASLGHRRSREAFIVE
jgi:hypothetical protein